MKDTWYIKDALVGDCESHTHPGRGVYFFMNIDDWVIIAGPNPESVSAVVSAIDLFISVHCFPLPLITF